MLYAMYKMDKKDIELYNIRMKMIKVNIGDSKYCSTCKKHVNGTYFTSLDGYGGINGGYATCALCRIAQNNKRHDRLILKRGYCNFSKLEAIIVEGNFIKAI
jgi:hypothetical protein